MTSVFSCRRFFKGIAMVMGAVVLIGLAGCSNGKQTIKGYVDTTPTTAVSGVDTYNDDVLLGSAGIKSIDTTRTYDIGGGVKMKGSIGVSFTRPKKSIVENNPSVEYRYYPTLTLSLQNTTDQPVQINVSQFTDASFNGSRVAVKGLKLGSNGFESSVTIPASTDAKKGHAVVRLYLDAPCDSSKYQNQPVSFTFGVNGARAVRCSGAFSEAPIFTIN